MAKYINTPSRETHPSGNIKGTPYQIRRAYGQVFLVHSPPPRTLFNEAEQAAQRRFAEATRLASIDMKNSQAKAYWESHKGTYKRAYDAAKSHYIQQLQVIEREEVVGEHVEGQRSSTSLHKEQSRGGQSKRNVLYKRVVKSSIISVRAFYTPFSDIEFVDIDRERTHSQICGYKMNFRRVVLSR